ncbi:MAG: hypothetical protein AABW59_00990 [archaeon]
MPVQRRLGRKILGTVGLGKPLFRGRVNRAIIADERTKRAELDADAKVRNFKMLKWRGVKLTPEQEANFDKLKAQYERRSSERDATWNRRQIAIDERSGKRFTNVPFTYGLLKWPTASSIRGPIRYALAGKEARERLKRMQALKAKR